MTQVFQSDVSVCFYAQGLSSASIIFFIIISLLFVLCLNIAIPIDFLNKKILSQLWTSSPSLKPRAFTQKLLYTPENLLLYGLKYSNGFHAGIRLPSVFHWMNVWFVLTEHLSSFWASFIFPRNLWLH